MHPTLPPLRVLETGSHETWRDQELTVEEDALEL